MKEIIVEIAADGSVHLEAIGYQGNSCEEATRFIEAALGTSIRSERKPEYFEPQQRTRNQQRLGR